MSRRILVVEDEARLRRVVQLDLETAGYRVETASTAEEALGKAPDADIVLTDLRLPAMDGLDLLSILRRQNPRQPVILMTAYGTIEKAVEAMKAGAFDFIVKPFSLDHLRAVIERAEKVASLEDGTRLSREQSGRYDTGNIIGRGPAMAEILATVMRVAPTRSTVLIAGESGTGKDLIARAIHYHSPRRDRPFVKINCSAIPESLMESELFGYERGAFTGAASPKPGKFEEADTGTVFLDEIGDVPLSVQVKLLRVLQERAFERLGSNRTRTVDVRVVAATNQNLEIALEQGTFRRDLYYRLNVVPIPMPALRQRKEDIPLLVGHFLEKYRQETGSRVERITPEAVEKLIGYDWPGNVRQLENVIERALVLCPGTELTPADVRLDEVPRGRTAPAFLPDGVTLEQHEQALIREALERAGGNKSKAARLLGLTRNALRYRLSQMGIE
jgi:DNA-binding NtrC family response regulator